MIGKQNKRTFTTEEVEAAARALFADYVEHQLSHPLADEWVPRCTVVVSEDGNLTLISAFHDDNGEPVEKWENYYQIHLEVHRLKARALIYIVSDRSREKIADGAWGPWKSGVSFFLFHQDYTPWHGVYVKLRQTRKANGDFLSIEPLPDTFEVRRFRGAIPGLFWDCHPTPGPPDLCVATEENLLSDGNEEVPDDESVN